jgi:hypothetical protein
MSERVIELVRTCPHDAQHQAALYAHVELIILQFARKRRCICMCYAGQKNSRVVTFSVQKKEGQ